MTNTQIDYFLSVAETKSIKRTAEALYVSAPAVSKQISLMEQELQMILFSRTLNGMELTEQGRIMFEYFTSQKGAMERAIGKARRLENSIPALHLGLMARWHLQPQMAQIRRLLLSNPCPVNLVTHPVFDPAAPARFDSGEFDAALCLGDELYMAALSNETHITPIAKIRKAFISAEAVLPKKESLTPQDFSDLPLLSYSPRLSASAYYDNLKLCNSHGFNPKLVQMNSHEECIFSAGTGDGFFIGDEWVDAIRLPGYRHCLLEEIHTIYLIWPAENRHPGLPLLEKICEREIQWHTPI